VLLVTALTVAAFPGLAAERSLLGEPAPPISLTSLAGDHFDLQDARGKTVVLHFGTGW
jgi:cytochrome oxidase Cu insertion factor (SCO1/SenC/PrrC family)